MRDSPAEGKPNGRKHVINEIRDKEQIIPPQFLHPHVLDRVHDSTHFPQHEEGKKKNTDSTKYLTGIAIGNIVPETHSKHICYSCHSTPPYDLEGEKLTLATITDSLYITINQSIKYFSTIFHGTTLKK